MNEYFPINGKHKPNALFKEEVRFSSKRPILNAFACCLFEPLDWVIIGSTQAYCLMTLKVNVLFNPSTLARMK